MAQFAGDVYSAANKLGIVNGFQQVEPPQYVDGEPIDGGVFRRWQWSDLIDANARLGEEDDRYLDGTMRGLFEVALNRWGDHPDFISCQERDPATGQLTGYSGRSLKDIDAYAEHLATALINLKLVESRTYDDETNRYAKTITPIFTMMKNREEFYILEQAANKCDLVLVPVYQTLGPEGIDHIFSEVQAKAIVCDYETLLSVSSLPKAKPSSWNIETVVLLEDGTTKSVGRECPYYLEQSPEYKQLKKALKHMRVTHLVPFPVLIKYGQILNKQAGNVDKLIASYENPTYKHGLALYDMFKQLEFVTPFEEALSKRTSLISFKPPKSDSIQTICYTSGTTGNPKGVLITHRNVTANALANTIALFPEESLRLGLRFGNNDSTLSILPLAHIFERLITSFNYILGVKIYVSMQDANRLSLDIAQARPTIMVLVPRLINKMVENLTRTIKSKGVIAKYLFDWGLNKKCDIIKSSNLDRSTFLWDSLFFDKIRTQIGGKLRLVLSGAAPLHESTQNAFEAAFGAHVIEGYGLTECTGAAMVRTVGDPVGCVGAPVASVEMKVAAVAEMELTDVPNQQKGELLLRGPSVSPGYFRNPHMNKEAYEGGWFKTGDIVQIDRETAQLRISDRRKACFKLCQGEYVSPEKVEGYLNTLSIVEQSFVTGNSFCRNPIALIVPSPTKLGFENEVTSTKNSSDEWMEYIERNHEDIYTVLMEEITATYKLFGLQGFEIPKRVKFIPHRLEEIPNLVTPTLKLKRNKVRSYYKVVLQELADKAK